MADIVVPDDEEIVYRIGWQPYIEVSGEAQLNFILYLRRDGKRAASLVGAAPGWRILALDTP